MSRNSPEGLGWTAKRRSSQKRQLRGSKKRLKRQLKYYYWRLIRLQGQPEALARGLACGVFAGLFPFAGSQTVLALLLAFIFRGNKILATVGPWISNPLTSVPIYLFNFQVGKWLLHDNSKTDVSFESWQDVIKLGSEVVLPLFVGCVAIGLVCAIFSYFVGLWVIQQVRDSNKQRHRRKRSKHLEKKYPHEF